MPVSVRGLSSFKFGRKSKGAVHQPPVIALKEDLVTLAPRPLYASDPKCIANLFDLREPQVCEQVHCLRAVWQADSDLEALSPDHMVVYLFPVTDQRIAA
jgi:hypothetical protein